MKQDFDLDAPYPSSDVLIRQIDAQKERITKIEERLNTANHSEHEALSAELQAANARYIALIETVNEQP